MTHAISTDAVQNGDSLPDLLHLTLVVSLWKNHPKPIFSTYCAVYSEVYYISEIELNLSTIYTLQLKWTIQLFFLVPHSPLSTDRLFHH